MDENFNPQSQPEKKESNSKPLTKKEEKINEDKELDERLKETFPASDSTAEY